MHLSAQRLQMDLHYLQRRDAGREHERGLRCDLVCWLCGCVFPLSVHKHTHLQTQTLGYASHKQASDRLAGRTRTRNRTRTCNRTRTSNRTRTCTRTRTSNRTRTCTRTPVPPYPRTRASLISSAILSRSIYARVGAGVSARVRTCVHVSMYVHAFEWVCACERVRAALVTARVDVVVGWGRLIVTCSNGQLFVHACIASVVWSACMPA
jgi:hypothetical protein